MIILVQCNDRIGLVAAIAGVLTQKKLNIISMREHVDKEANRFFARIVSGEYSDVSLLRNDIKAVLPDDAVIGISTDSEKKIIVMVSKEYHCLGDILVRNHFKTLDATVQCVISNHEVLKDICDRFEVPFFFIPHENKSRRDFESGLLEVINKYSYHYLVLAKFMRILSPEFVDVFPVRMVNIHHSFLPAFAGANPYRQAHTRGVKLIGATAHFVTNDLDEGPIIEQKIIPVNHTYTTEDMKNAGKEVEKSVLAKALKMVFEDRVFVYNNKTVVFE